MKRVITMLIMLITLLSFVSCSTIAKTVGGSGEENNSIHNPGELVSDWQTSLQYLQDGNQRFISDKMMVRNTNAEDRAILKEGQRPFAVVLTCADSRVSPEIYFDQKLGDIFVIRNAGNIADETALGSIEYAVEHLKSPLVVVVGHSRCGAVDAAFSGSSGNPDNLQSIIDKIKLAIEGSADADDAIHNNIEKMAEKMKENEVIEEMGAKVLSAYYNIESGEVLWLQ